MNNIYANIKAIRIAKELKQEDVADKLGLAPSNYGRVERGLTEITIERLEKIAEIFGMSVNAIMTYNKENPSDFKEDAEFYYNHAKKLETQIAKQKKEIEEMRQSDDEYLSGKFKEIDELKVKIKTLQDKLKERDKMIQLLEKAMDLLGQKNTLNQ